MALGVPGTGPYGKIRKLQQEITNCKYVLTLIDQGLRDQRWREGTEMAIAANRAAIRKIKARERKKKRKPEASAS